MRTDWTHVKMPAASPCDVLHVSNRFVDFVVVVIVVLVFYGPSTHFRSFRARSVNLATLFLDKPPRQFTSTLCPFFRQLLTTALLNQRKGENGEMFHHQISTKECSRTGARTIDPLIRSHSLPTALGGPAHFIETTERISNL